MVAMVTIDAMMAMVDDSESAVLGAVAFESSPRHSVVFVEDKPIAHCHERKQTWPDSIGKHHQHSITNCLTNNSIRSQVQTSPGWSYRINTNNGIRDFRRLGLAQLALPDSIGAIVAMLAIDAIDAIVAMLAKVNDGHGAIVAMVAMGATNCLTNNSIRSQVQTSPGWSYRINTNNGIRDFGRLGLGQLALLELMAMVPMVQ